MKHFLLLVPLFLFGAGCETVTQASSPPSVAPLVETEQQKDEVKQPAQPAVEIQEPVRVEKEASNPIPVPSVAPTPQTVVPAPAVKPAPALVETKSCSCPTSDLDCPDFSSHEEAQAVFNCCEEKYGYDYHKLDRDADGLACETL